LFGSRVDVKKTKVVTEISEPKFVSVFGDLIASIEKHDLSPLERLYFFASLYEEMNLLADEAIGKKIDGLEPHETEQ